ncbi:hypothetical protein FRC04_000185 [Tulasnella sp. 424]|nr:hypothetical protein FRC04_000185 [Tulasnella sp. 424]
MPVLLSKHSSNPLQAPSDDPVNKKYLKEISSVLAREKNRGSRDTSSVHDAVEEEDVAMMGSDDDEDALGERTFVPEDESDVAEDEDDEECSAEERTLYLKDPVEQRQILDEIADLEKSVPRIVEDFILIDRLGEGTFSSVYKAIDKNYHKKWYNKLWQGQHGPFVANGKAFVAVKRIYVTSSPSRIQNEIALMEDCRGCRHVAQLITAFREKDQVVAVMPYHKNVDFRQYYTTIPMSGIQSYLRCLLRALRDVHAREIVHRDVKPANFLFDPDSGLGVLVDFGLAQVGQFNRYCISDTSHLDLQKVDFDVETSCNHTAASKDDIHGALKSFSRDDVERMKDVLAEARERSKGPSDRVGWLAEETRHGIKANRAGTRGFRAPEVLLKCEDQTAALDIWSVGTILLSFLSGKFPIFNANDDVEALMEIAAILGKRKMEKCAQLHNRSFICNVPSIDHTGISWREVAERLNPSLVPPTSSPNPGDEYQRSTDPLLPLAFDLLENMLLPDMTKRITARDSLFHPFLLDPLPLPEGAEAPADLYDWPIEAREYRDPETDEVIVAQGDDLYVPHPYGEGVCKRGHWVDEDTGDQCCFVVIDDGSSKPETERKKKGDKRVGIPDEKRQARLKRRLAKERELGIFRINLDDAELDDEHDTEESKGQGAGRVMKVRVKKLAAGEGIAIGLEPCEFHQNGLIDASYWHSHLRPMLDQELRGEEEQWNGTDDERHMDQD